MKILNSVEQLKKWQAENLKKSKIGFVPTMGSLHQGHLELVKASLADSDVTVTSIFLNPTQFNKIEDLEKYPIQIEADLEKLEALSIQAVFLPKAEEIYHDQYRFRISETEDSQVLCGKHRPGHFEGVLTVVLKLFHLVRPNIAFFGQKDFQQLHLIRQMVMSFFLPIEIKSIETVREPDGLAMSSRNLRLSPSARERAPKLYQALLQNKTLEELRKDLENDGFEIEYLEEHWGRRFIAANIEGIRLIDNVSL